jgi:hypothetical protein
MIGQQLGLPYLMPIALRVLKESPWASGDLHEGDLLVMVLSVKPEFWVDNHDWARELQAILANLGPVPADPLGLVSTDDLEGHVRRLIETFTQETLPMVERQLRRGPLT